MYKWLELGPMLRLVPHIPSIQGNDEGLYCPKAHIQCGRKYCGGHRGHPGPMSVLIPPRRSGVLTCRTNQWCGRDCSTVWHQRLFHSPISHWDWHPKNCYTNSHQGHQIKFKPPMTNGRYWRGILTFCQLQQWRHVNGQFWHKIHWLGLLRSSNNLPASSDKFPGLAAQIDKLKHMHKDVRAYLKEFFSPRVLFNQTCEINPTELYKEEAKPEENPWDNGATPMLPT